jgi:hypothetical protein
MAIKLGDVYKTPSDKFLQVSLISETRCHHFIEVHDNVNRQPIPEQRNKFGHVTRRTSLVYSEEVIATFKKLNPI